MGDGEVLRFLNAFSFEPYLIVHRRTASPCRVWCIKKRNEHFLLLIALLQSSEQELLLVSRIYPTAERRGLLQLTSR